MCGRYILVQKVEVLEKRFNCAFQDASGYMPSYNICPGQSAVILTYEDGNTLRMSRFGLTPFWSKKNQLFINARSEGDKNKENKPDYTGGLDIINKPAFRKPIRSQRCLVIADAFIEGTTKEKLSKPFLVYLRNKVRPFAMAGIWDVWRNPESGEEVHSFAIITTVANQLMQRLPHHRSPVILPQPLEQKWIHPKTALTDITSMLRAFPSELMNAYPIGPDIKNPRNNSRELILPIGPPVDPEDDIQVSRSLKLQGMGNPRVK